MRVTLSEDFGKKVVNFPKKDKEKIFAFIEHLETFGFDGLKGRNKSSDNVPTNHPNWLERVKYAQKHKLWHYHIGIPNYETANNGDLVSEYILHYIVTETENCYKADERNCTNSTVSESNAVANSVFEDYIREENEIKLVALSYHPPFELPTENALQ